MNEIIEAAESFIRYCRFQRNMSSHTLRAYAGDLKLFTIYLSSRQPQITKCTMITKQILEGYLDRLSQDCTVKTIKRKFACIHSFVNYLE